MIKLLVSISLSMMVSFSVWSRETTEAQRTYEDIKQTLGSVPTFLKNFPADGIAGAWADMKGIQLNAQSAIPGKYKELMGVAVSAQVPCSYCIYFHTQAAMVNQANTEELREAIAMAASVRKWSTFLNGMQYSLSDFKSEVDKMFNFSEKNKNRQAMDVAPMEAKKMMTAQDAYKDIEQSVGFVPTFFKDYPQVGIVGAWKSMKSVDMNPESKIPGKYKDLIALAVSAQTPCAYCTYYHTKSAMFQGATAREVAEAVALAGITRSWSTVINGLPQHLAKFKGETDKVMNFLKTKNKKVTTL